MEPNGLGEEGVDLEDESFPPPRMALTSTGCLSKLILSVNFGGLVPSSPCAGRERSSVDFLEDVDALRCDWDNAERNGDIDLLFVGEDVRAGVKRPVGVGDFDGDIEAG